MRQISVQSRKILLPAAPRLGSRCVCVQGTARRTESVWKRNEAVQKLPSLTEQLGRMGTCQQTCEALQGPD